MVYTNNLHQVLLKKNGPAFWKCLRANFEPGKKCVEVEYTHNNEDRAKALCAEYNHVRSNYCGFLKPMITQLILNWSAMLFSGFMLAGL